MCAGAEAKPESRCEKWARFSRTLDAAATSAAARAIIARLCLAARRDIATIPPLQAFGRLFIVISKRDPAPSFNRYFHIDAGPLTWSYRCPQIEQRARTMRQQMLDLARQQHGRG
jgi:hypothetical protein